MLLCTSLLVIFSISDGINAGYSLCPSPSLAIIITLKHCTKDCKKHLGGITPSISYAFDGVIILLKSTIGPSSFCQGAPQKFAAFMNYCRILAFSKKQENSFVHIAMKDATCPSGLEHLTQLLTNYHCIVSSRILCSAWRLQFSKLSSYASDIKLHIVARGILSSNKPYNNRDTQSFTTSIITYLWAEDCNAICWAP